MADKSLARTTRALLSAILAFGVLGAEVLHAPSAEAQQRRGLLDMLFGGGRPETRQAPQRAEPPPQRRQVKKVRKKRSEAAAPRKRSTKATAAAGAAAGATAAAAAVADAEPVQKSESARTVLVVGDFMAGSLAKGLEEAVSQNREIRVVSKVDGSSGLVRDDHFDWPGEIAGTIAKEKPAVVVVMLGANDRQAIRDAGSSLALRTAEWSERYTARVEALASAVRASGASLVWVGALPFGIDRASEDMVYFNDLYRTAALKAGGEFVDVWGGFTDANGAFTASGPDMAGQTARLRNSDGITLTGAGQDKLAYFVEKPVTRILGLSVDDLVASLGPQQLSAADLPSAGDLASTTTTPPVSFSDPALDGGDKLLGGAPAVAPQATDASPRAKLVVTGAPHDTTEGRADHFNWTGRSGAVSPVTRENAIVFRGSTTLDELRRQSKDAEQPETAGAADAAARNLPAAGRP